MESSDTCPAAPDFFRASIIRSWTIQLMALRAVLAGTVLDVVDMCNLLSGCAWLGAARVHSTLAVSVSNTSRGAGDDSPRSRPSLAAIPKGPLENTRVRA